MKNKALLTIILFLNISFFILSFTTKTENTTDIINTTANNTEVLLSKILVELTKLNEKNSNQVFNNQENLNLANNLMSASNLNEIENIANEVLSLDNNAENDVFNEETIISFAETTEERIVLEENKEVVSTLSNQFQNNRNYNAALVDKIDDIYFGSTNETRSIDNMRKDKLTDNIIEIEKDLEEFSTFNDFIHPDAIAEQKQQQKIEDATEFVSDEHELTPSNYYDIKNIDKHLKAENIESEFTGYAVNLIVSNEVLTTENIMFQTFGGLKVEKTLNGQYRYFIDNFQTKKGAKDYLEKIILPRFPEAEAVFYKKGQRKSNAWQFLFGPK